MSQISTYANLTTLKGSERQVRWARQIRDSFIRQLDPLSVSQLATMFLEFSSKEDIVRARFTTVEELGRGLISCCQHLVANPDAQWWINNRDRKVEELLPASWKTCIDHWATTEWEKAK